MKPGLAARRRSAESTALGILFFIAVVGAQTAAAQPIERRATAALESPNPAGQDPVRQASGALMQWRRDWENRDFERFSAHYAEAFQSNGLDRLTYLERKRGVFEKRPWQRIRINEVLWIAEQGLPDALSVRFIQEYDSPQGSDRSRKEQRWVRVNQRWQLAGETELFLSELDPNRAKARSGAGGAVK